MDEKKPAEAGLCFVWASYLGEADRRDKADRRPGAGHRVGHSVVSVSPWTRDAGELELVGADAGG